MLKMKNKLLKKSKKMSIRNKTTLFYTLLFSVTFIFLTIFVLLNIWAYYQSVSREELSDTMDKVVEYIKSGNYSQNSQDIDELSPNANIGIRVLCFPKDGNGDGEEFENGEFKIVHKPPSVQDPPPPPKITDFNQDDTRDDNFKNETFRGIHYTSKKSNIEYDGKQYFIEVYRTNEKENSVISQFGIIFIIANIIGIIAAICIGRFISKKVLNPVAEITKMAEKISINDLGQRITVPNSDDEISNLAETFNDMISRLEISFEKQKEFVSNASHELKTPISVIQGYANLVDRWGKSDPEILKESIDSIKDETEYMSNLIKKLLFLAKNEQIKLDEKKQINLNATVSAVVKETDVLDINGEVNFIENADVEIMGDDSLIKQLLWVFFENAIKYSDKDYIKIDVEVSKEDNMAVLKISDNGMGISEEDIPHIFDRFFRADKSHNKKITGNGLGLSIAAIIIKQHNGEISVESELGKGTQFKMRFPLVEV